MIVTVLDNSEAMVSARYGAVPGAAGESADPLVQQPAEHEERDHQPEDPGRDHNDLVGHLQLAVIADPEERREALRHENRGVTDQGHGVTEQNRHLAVLL
jgi:hypothetical protein